ncbi:lipase [Mesorhizobium sp. VNQ89]|uniref:lipase n=1 Tax=Mesorhizobium quangtriensis TaxID=3157709 RepID=UPI0032B7D061
MIGRRCVFFIGGYDPKTPAAFFRRLSREMELFETTWDVQSSRSDVATPEGDVGILTVTSSHRQAAHPQNDAYELPAEDRDWQVTTDFYFLGLDSIVTTDAARPLSVRLFRYLVAFFDYWLTGTAFSFFSRSWRFALYFLYPFVTTVFLFLVAFFASSAVLRFLGIDSLAIAMLIALVALFPLLATLGKRWSVTHLMDLWSFSSEYLRGKRPEAERLMDRYAAIVAQAAKAQPYDEIILVGHSTGGGLILEMAARSLVADPLLASRDAGVSLLTLGSTALKFGLHPAASAFRARVQTLVDEPALGWSEFQCLIDVINFYNTDPVVEMALRPRSSGGAAFPVIRKVHLRDMMGVSRYRQIRRRFFRIHYQFIMGNAQRYFYDFFHICFGPDPLWAITPAASTERPAEAVREAGVNP